MVEKMGDPRPIERGPAAAAAGWLEAASQATGIVRADNHLDEILGTDPGRRRWIACATSLALLMVDLAPQYPRLCSEIGLDLVVVLDLEPRWGDEFGRPVPRSRREIAASLRAATPPTIAIVEKSAWGEVTDEEYRCPVPDARRALRLTSRWRVWYREWWPPGDSSDGISRALYAATTLVQAGE